MTTGTGAALWSFAVMVLGGMGVGALATLYGSARTAVRWGPLSGGFGDVLWFVPATGIFLASLALATWGELRLWAIVAAAVGFGLWMGLAHPVVGWVATAACRVGAWATDRLTRPGRWAARHLVRGAAHGVQGVRALAGRLVRIDRGRFRR
ncbi:MAG: spore cortex biosynthesis protein YabQ [Actinomycetia bacterium]|nr:spore cortex biosynthesis protein YabQ [Actinomycetes bacterium]